jgi:cytochrome bd-type quinol oxidase subunit 2
MPWIVIVIAVIWMMVCVFAIGQELSKKSQPPRDRGLIFVAALALLLGLSVLLSATIIPCLV